MKHAILTICLLGLIGAAAVVAGVYLLVGIGWALLALGVLLFAAGAIMARGLTRG